MDTIKQGLFILMIALITSCSNTRVVKTLDPREKQVGACLGGPAIMFSGAPIALPLSSLSYAQGIDTTVTLTSSIHTTDLLFGVIHIEGGTAVSAYESKNERFGVTVTPSMHLILDIWEWNMRTYPQFDALSWYQYSVNSPKMIYGGLGTWIELNKVKAHGKVQTNEVLPWFMIGHQWLKPRWTYTLEAKYLGFQHSTNKLVVDYISPMNHGALGVYFGISRRLIK